ESDERPEHAPVHRGPERLRRDRLRAQGPRRGPGRPDERRHDPAVHRLPERPPGGGADADGAGLRAGPG
ncbi:unnamed protein product, partial [Heterosigma akashiwo]